jgi:NADH dehydrogenase/NADH:ubiquinone oxidoreductase subunit G
MDINLTIDNKSVTIPEDSTLLEAGQACGSPIPTICFHEATTSNALCRICVVEVAGQRLLQPACIVKVSEGMQVQTRSERVIRARRTILEMLAASVDLSDSPAIIEMMQEYGASPERFPGSKKRQPPVIDDNPMYIRDYAKCVLCWRCVQVCAEDAQYTYAINFGGRGFETSVNTFFELPMPASTCVFCGQCVGVCPSGALKPKREFLLEQGNSPEQIAAMHTGRKQSRPKSS